MPAIPAAGLRLRPQRADARRNRAKVIDAARAAFAESGLDAQVDGIAKAAGVGVGTVYRHFPTKDDLLQALTDAFFESLAEAARTALEHEDGWEGFVEFMTYSARVTATDQALSEAMDQRPGLCGNSAAKVDLLELTGRVVARAQATGELRPDVVAIDVPGLICGCGRSVRTVGGQPSIGWQRHLAIILAGLRTPAGGAEPLPAG